jgi:hypothetical protein
VRWTGLIDRGTGDLASVGTVLAPDAAERFDLIDFGADPPDWGAVEWDAGQRRTKPRVPPVLIDRLDDIEAALMANADFASVWQSLGAARRTTIRTGIRDAIAPLLTRWRYRRADQATEL